jgi:hypothetical protein
MKTLFVGLLGLFSITVFGQNGANEILVAPSSNSPYILVDTLFTLDNYPATYTDVYVHFANPTVNNIKAVQFRLFYDNSKFSSATMLWGPTAQSVTDKYGSYFDNNSNGYLNVIATYTGNTASFDWADGAMFKLRLFHGAGLVGVADSIAISGVSSYNNLATTGNGVDISLGLFNYGGNFQMTSLTFPVRVRNVDATPAQGVWFTAQKRLKNTSGSWTVIATDSTNSNGIVQFTHTLDTNYWHLRLTAQADSMTDGGAISIVDAYKLANHVTMQDTLSGVEWYAGDINESGNATISDAFAVFNRLALNSATWNGLFSGVYNVSVLWQSEWNTAKSAVAAPNWVNKPRVYVIDTIVNSMDTLEPYIYVIGDATTTGYNNPATILAKLNPSGSGITEYVLDPAVYQMQKPDTVQFRFPKLTVTSDNYIDIPVTMYTFGNKIGAAQLGFEFDTNIFEFTSVQVGEVAAKWTSFISIENGRVMWAGHEDKMNPGVLEAMSNAFTFRFRVKTIQGWTSTPIRIINKAAGDERAEDLSIKPSPNDGSIVNGRGTIDPETLNLMTGFKVYPNPVTDITGGWAVVEFYTEDMQPFTMIIANIHGQIVKAKQEFINETGFQARGIYLGDLPKGTYIVRLVMNDRDKVYKLIKY